jgi:hypothetical protein
METRNAVITGVWIEADEFETLSAGISLDYGDSGQIFGGNGLYTPKRGVGGKNYAGHFLYRVLEIAGVSRWDELKGKTIRVIQDDAHVEAIGHIVKDVWFNMHEEFKLAKQEVSA